VGRLSGAIFKEFNVANPKNRRTLLEGKTTWRGVTTSTSHEKLGDIPMNAQPRSVETPSANSLSSAVTTAKVQPRSPQFTNPIFAFGLPPKSRKLLAKGKNKGVVVTAVGSELLGFIWAIGIKVETAQKESLQRA